MKFVPAIQSKKRKLTALLKKISFPTPVKKLTHSASHQIQRTRHRFKKVLMFGWELPPFNSGGLGVASYELAKSLSQKGWDITFVLPRRQDVQAPFMKVRFADHSHITVKEIDSILTPYMTSEMYTRERRGILSALYGNTLFDEVRRYAHMAADIARSEGSDLIHAHDWLTFPAGIEAQKAIGRPLIAHVHSTELDRTGSHGNSIVYTVEKEGMQWADRVIAVSNFTRQRIIEEYGIFPHKVDVVYNGVHVIGPAKLQNNLDRIKKSGKKIVLFVGRITIQKGPDYFISVAQQVLQKDPNVLFFVSGSGDMEHQIIQMAAYLGISDKIIFTGFLRDSELTQIYRVADVFVMPSVAEPFGIAALEAMAHRTPLIVSRQSGVSEVITHALKVDFWDTQLMAEKILAVIHYSSLRQSLRENGYAEVQLHNWDRSADACSNVYYQVLH